MDTGWCDKNGTNESFKMSPHLTCLSWNFNFHITSRPDPEAGQKRDLGCQLRHIKWGLILKLSMRLLSWHSPKSLRISFHFEFLSRPVPTIEMWYHPWWLKGRHALLRAVQCPLVLLSQNSCKIHLSKGFLHDVNWWANKGQDKRGERPRSQNKKT